MLVAFDHSLTCPCMCISTKPGITNCRFWYLTSVKNAIGVFDPNVIGVEHKEYKTEQERYHNISDFFIGILDRQNVSQYTPIFIEDYSFGSKGRVFGIAENTGLLKHKLWERGHEIDTIPPTVIKKFATSAGNADKQDMYNSFYEKTMCDLHTNISKNRKLGSPVTDIVDAYFIAEYGHDLIKNVGT